MLRSDLGLNRGLIGFERGFCPLTRRTHFIHITPGFLLRPPAALLGIGTVSGKVADDDDWEGSVWSVCHGLMGGSEWSALEELFLAAVSPCSLRVSLVHSTMFISYSAC